LKWLFAATTVRVTALYLAKLSIATSLLAIHKTRNMSKIMYALIGVLSMSWVFSYVVIFAQCMPLERKWEIFQIENRKPGKCWDSNVLFICRLIEDGLFMACSD